MKLVKFLLTLTFVATTTSAFGAAPEFTDISGDKFIKQFPLFHAVLKDDVGEVEALINAGHSVHEKLTDNYKVRIDCSKSTRSYDGYPTALTVFAFMLDEGHTPLTIAVRQNRMKVIQLLIESGAEPDEQHINYLERLRDGGVNPPVSLLVELCPEKMKALEQKRRTNKQKIAECI